MDRSRSIRWTVMFDSQEFQSLRREYIDGAQQRCRFLQEAAAQLRQGDQIDLKALRQEIHKLRGSGGFYGFPQLSAASGAAEDQLIMVLDGDIERDDHVLAGLVDALVAAVQEAARSLAD